VHGAELTRLHGHQVVGVDLSEASILKAKMRLHEAYVADVTQPARYPFWGHQSFDLIVFSDLLEHMSDPLAVLAGHYPLLADGGRILISLPNVAIWNVRLGLLAGRFDYTDTGTLDRTHLRFFTRSLRRFLSDAELIVHRSRISPGVVRPFVPLVKKLYGRGSSPSVESDSSSIMDSTPYRFYMRWLYPVERALCALWPGMFAFQFIVLAEPKAVARAFEETPAAEPMDQVDVYS
jgi:SAM-dependent methyltransferase